MNPKTRRMIRYNNSRTKKHIRRRKQTGGSILHLAVMKGNLIEVKRLISEGNIDINIFYDGLTVLMVACLWGFTDIVKFLLTVEGIDVNKKTVNNQYSALMIAAIRNRNDIISELLKVPGIDINAKNAYGITALSLTGSDEIKKQLVNAGATEGVALIKEDEDTFLNTINIPAGSYILFCSEGYRTIPDGELPSMPYFWTQLSPTEPSPKDSWFCSSKNLTNNTFYVYKIIRPLSLLNVSDNDEFGEKLIDMNPSLKEAIRFPVMQHADDYVDIAIQYNLFNVDGVYRDLNEIILFSPYHDKLEFVKRYGGEKAKTLWLRSNAKMKGYYNPSHKVLYTVKDTLVSSPYYDKIKRYFKI